MMTYYGRVVRWSLALTSVVAAVAVVICAVLGGAKGTYGSLIGVGVVAVFFGISILAVSRAAKISPMAMMVAALGSFVEDRRLHDRARHDRPLHGVQRADARLYRPRVHSRLVVLAGRYRDEASVPVRRAGREELRQG